MYEELNLDLDWPADASNSDINNNIVYISHNSVLNCLFLITSDAKLILFDCNTRTKLKQIDWQSGGLGGPFSFLRIHNIQDKCIVVSDKTICSRLANEGLFLLDTVFQPAQLNLSSLSNSPEASSSSLLRTLELGLNDSISLLNSLKQLECDSINGLDSLIKQIQTQVDTLSQPVDDTSWKTVQITDNYFTLLTLLTQCLDEIKRINLQSVSIPILSLLLDRLYRLDLNLIERQLQVLNASTALANQQQQQGGGAQAFMNFDKRYMCSEATRRATFNEWPHMDYKWVLPDALAQAGFYHQPTHQGDDRTICFVCDLCLVAWEQHDQPWSEHERHSPICQFVRGEITENVPLSLTAATQAANIVFKAADSKDSVVCTSDLSSERYFAVSNASGHIIVYDSKDILKVKIQIKNLFCLDNLTFLYYLYQKYNLIIKSFEILNIFLKNYFTENLKKCNLSF